jgi:predicted PurR-regulated permease PerM
MLSLLSEELRQKIRNMFEPKYKRKLTEFEIDEIATNLSGYAKAMVRFQLLKKHPELIKK